MAFITVIGEGGPGSEPTTTKESYQGHKGRGKGVRGGSFSRFAGGSVSPTLAKRIQQSIDARQKHREEVEKITKASTIGEGGPGSGRKKGSMRKPNITQSVRKPGGAGAWGGKSTDSSLIKSYSRQAGGYPVRGSHGDTMVYHNMATGKYHVTGLDLSDVASFRNPTQALAHAHKLANSPYRGGSHVSQRGLGVPKDSVKVKAKIRKYSS